ncbi:MAG TPA: SBBP repeat-containing protein [Ignavibacteriaceae bacterium]|nr:SBBP repeat-containing protein [Ignavibacteriaceae bacterium]
MKTFLTILIILYFTQHIFSQIEPEWIQRYENPGFEFGEDIAIDHLGNIYVAGSINDPADVVVIKYSPAGEELWVRTYNGPDNYADYANAIAVDISGNVYISGRTDSDSNDEDYLTIKYDTDGNRQWVRTYNGPISDSDEALAIAVDDSGNVYVTGESKNYFENWGYHDDIATLKYDTNGNVIWARRYDPPSHSVDVGHSVAVDRSGNVFVTGNSSGDCITLKYSPSGGLLWLRNFNGPFSGTDYGNKIVTDSLGNAYVTGRSQESGSLDAYLTIKYSDVGTELWVQRKVSQSHARSITLDDRLNIYVTGGGGTVVKYTKTGSEEWSVTNGGSNGSIGVDQSGNVYAAGSIFVTGQSNNFRTIKYDSSGVLQWNYTYNGPGNGDDQAFALAVDQLGNVYVTGYSTGIGTQRDVTTMKFAGTLRVLEPAWNDKWIAGETDTIKWTETDWLSVNIKCILNFETPIEEEIILAEGYPVVDSEFEWEIPDTLLSYRSKIIIENANNPVEKMESDIFRIKPYVLTRLNADSTYYEYRKNRDRWGFENIDGDIWPPEWYNQFDYKGLDPFTNINYPQFVLDSLFIKAKRSDHPDWISWVRTFGETACYANVAEGIYYANALLNWKAQKEAWGGSCFGIAISNALAFQTRDQFQNKYPEYPNFIAPIDVESEPGVKRVINELYTHQTGNPHSAYRSNIGLLKTPNETLNDVKEMMKQDNSIFRTLSFNSNDTTDPGGHAIVVYGLKQDLNFKEIYYLKLYDNSYPNVDSEIIIDTTSNGGNGVWNYPTGIFTNWGGNKWIYLRDPAVNYFNDPTMAKSNGSQSPFILETEELQIYSKLGNSIQIQDLNGNVTGYFNEILQVNIPGSTPFIVDNGTPTPPYGYSLPTNDYSVVLSEFAEDTLEAFFFTGNKSFSYERFGVTQSQTDRLFFDGGVSVTNPDAQTKTVKLLNLINETEQEKLTVLRSIDLVQNDSIKIENPDSNKVKLISYGSSKDYDIELNYVTENGLGRFGDFNIQLSVNTSHTFVPDWTNLTNSQLMVLVDVGNDGTIDDTLYISNTVDVEDQGSLITPDSYNLAQNYPNPFNPVTTIQYSIPLRSSVTLKVYDVLGNEIATLVNEEKDRGVYSVIFDASQLASGIYLYRIQAGSYVETKKMILLR